MPGDETATSWIRELRAGNEAAAQRIWERYYRQLVCQCRAMLPDGLRRAADEEDVVLSAFDSFCRGVEKGRFPSLRDQRDLWQVLLMIARRKVVDQVERETRQKRGCGRVRGGSAAEAIDRTPSGEPPPELAAIVKEEYARLMAGLADETTRNVAQWKLEGFSDEEIAGRLGCSVRTVQRKLWLIRRTWTDEGEHA